MSSVDALSAALADRYRIERELGTGGMATVYLARDLKHDRDVALKVLKPELAAVLGADRFIVEIKTTASLQHPHILPLFDSGTAGGFLFYVMPYIAGETIREKLNRETQFGVDEAVRLAREIADALDYAHRHGVIHRDIKPENILLHDGRAMVMDFGIALALSAAAGGRMTETGLSLGTPHYMSPEQATAEKELTPRSDVYSLASVLYEMLAGQPPHIGGAAQQVIMRIITEPARPVSEFRKNVEPNVVAALAKALEKLPADRFESAKAFSDALANPVFATVGTNKWATNASVARRPNRREAVAWLLVAGLATLSASILNRLRTDSAPVSPAVRFELPLPLQSLIAAGTGPELALTTDGRTLVYHAQGPAEAMLARHAMGETGSTLIAGTEKATHFAISPNGKWVAFVADSQLRKVPIDGGPPTPLASSVSRPISWASNDVIVLGDAAANGLGLSTVAAAGGTVRAITKLDSARRESSQRWPRALSDGKTVLYASFLAGGGLAAARIGIASIETGATTVLNVEGDYPFGVFDGHLVYARSDGAIMAVPIDLARRRVNGEPMLMLGNVAMGGAGASKAALSDNGTLIYDTGNSNTSLVLVDSTGLARSLTTLSARINTPRFSPNGRRIAVAIGDMMSSTHDAIWVFEREDFAKLKLPSADTVRRFNPEWSADGRQLYFLSGNPSDTITLLSQASDGSSSAGRVTGGNTSQAIRSHDGRSIVFTTGRAGKRELQYRFVAGDTTPRPLVVAQSDAFSPALSPDDRWLAYVSHETGKDEVYVTAYPGPVSKIAVSIGGGVEPRWATDGRHIFFRSSVGGSPKLMSAAVVTSPTFAVGARSALFDDRFVRSGQNPPHYDVAPDGKNFVMILRGDSASKVVGIVNFLSALREGQTPTKK